jgi:hypothetical protein
MSEEISGFRENFSEFRNLKVGNFGKFRVFIKTALRSSVTCKISVKLIEIRVFSEKIPENPQDVKSQIPGKKVQFSGFFSTQRYSLFLENPREKISGKIGRFRRKISRKSEIGKFGNRKISEKKVPKRRFWKIQPSFAERVLKRTF